MKAHLRYLSYVLRHKWFVLLAGLETGAPFWRLIVHDWSKFLPSEWGPYARKFFTVPTLGEWVDGVCDNSPFEGTVVDTRPSCEGNGRVDCYIREPSGRCSWMWAYEVCRPAVDAAFSRAWLKHLHRNPHHWDHWVMKDGAPTAPNGGFRALPMPDHFIREMVADWMGAGQAQGKPDVAAWYRQNAGKMLLHPDTRRRVEELLQTVAPASEQDQLQQVAA